MPSVGIIMGSKSDYDIVKPALDILSSFGVEHEVIVASAHRTPARTSKWSREADQRGVKAIIAYAGAAAHLAGVVASETNVPVIAVPVAATALNGVDALYSMVQMPGGIPVACMAIGTAGSKNAALFACQILALSDDSMKEKLHQYRIDMEAKVIADNDDLQSALK